MVATETQTILSNFPEVVINILYLNIAEYFRAYANGSYTLHVPHSGILSTENAVALADIADRLAMPENRSGKISETDRIMLGVMRKHLEPALVTPEYQINNLYSDFLAWQVYQSALIPAPAAPQLSSE